MRKLRHFVLIILKHDLNRSFELCHIDCNWQESPDKDQRSETMIKGTYRSLPLRNPYPPVSETNFTRIWYYFRFFDLDSNSSVPLYWSPWWLFCASYEYQGSMDQNRAERSCTKDVKTSYWTEPGANEFWKLWTVPNQGQNNFEIIGPYQDQFENLAVHEALLLTTPALPRSNSER